MARMKIVKFTDSHKNIEKFPYNADDLALYMQHVIDRIDNEQDIENLSSSDDEEQEEA